jgi:hypothetical protein
MGQFRDWGPPPVVGTLFTAYTLARDILAGTPVTGRRWKRPPRGCPDWCAENHTCTAQYGYPNGEHRSPPTTWRTPYGVLVATRVQGVDGAPRLELRVQANLSPGNGNLAFAQGVHLPVAVDLAVRTVLAELAWQARLGYGDDPRPHQLTGGQP